MNEQTLARAVRLTGMALHTGTHNTMILKPAAEGTGIRFRRIDLGPEAVVPAKACHVRRTDRCTTLGTDDVEVSTVEHLLSALRGLEIDNVEIDIDGPEVPIADGSAQRFVELIEEAGIVEQSRPRTVRQVTAPLWVRHGDKVVAALPYDGFKVSLTFTNDHGHPVLGDLFAEIDVTPQSYRSEIAPARTIGWLSEVEALQARGLAMGATMEMAVVLSEDEVLTPLRFPNEPARHKILDVVGDLSLAGFVKAHIVAIRSSHALNTELAQALATCEAVVESVARQ